MRDSNSQHQRKKQDEPESYPDAPMASYTPEQEKVVMEGLRILARVAARAHMRRQAAPPDSRDGTQVNES